VRARPAQKGSRALTGSGLKGGLPNKRHSGVGWLTYLSPKP